VTFNNSYRNSLEASFVELNIDSSTLIKTEVNGKHSMTKTEKRFNVQKVIIFSFFILFEENGGRTA
jgi:hypothetical protein